MTQAAFHLDQLRAFVAVVDAQGFTAAARREDMLQSTLSMRIRKLEELAGQPLLLRLGRQVVPTAAGHRLAEQAYRILGLCDQAWGDLASTDLSGRVRIGIPDDYLDQVADVLREYRQKYPGVELAVSSAFSVELAKRVQAGDLDIAVVTRQPNVPGGEVLRREAMLWVSAPDFTPDAGNEWSLSAYPKDICSFRTAMTSALTAAGMPWRIAFTSTSLTGQTAVVGAGLAVTVMTRRMAERAKGYLSKADLPDLPPLPDVELAMLRRAGRPTEAARLMADMIGVALSAE